MFLDSMTYLDGTVKPKGLTFLALPDSGDSRAFHIKVGKTEDKKKNKVGHTPGDGEGPLRKY